MDPNNFKESVIRLRKLIDGEANEFELQRYLEAHPYLVVRKHPIGSTVIAQFPLGVDYRTDFAYAVSGTVPDFYLIEIERPNTPLFTKDDEFTQEFNHARQQIFDWQEWCLRNPHYLHQTLLHLREYYLPRWTLRHDVLERSAMVLGSVSCRCILIIGRRSQITNARRQARWKSMKEFMGRGLSVRTFDGGFEALNHDSPGYLNTVSFNRAGEIVRAGAEDIKCVTYMKQSFREKEI